MSKIAKIIDKIASGEFKELTDRVHEELTKRQERATHRCHASQFRETSYAQIFAENFFKRFSKDKRTIDFTAALRSHDSAKFYPGFAKRELFKEYIEKVCPEERDRIIRYADEIAANRFPTLGLGLISYGEPPQWNFDPLMKVSAPERFYADIDYLNPATVGDAKMVWELSRLQFVYDLGQAYVLTGDEKYAEKFFALLHDWSKRNRDFHGVNYCSALECAFRIHSLFWGICFFKDSPSLTDKFAEDIYRTIYVSASFVEDHLSRYFAPNTHLLGEAYALFVVGMLFPEFRHAGIWQTRGYKIFTEELSNQFTDDGMHAELSTAYHAYAAEFVLSIVILSERCHSPLGARYHTRLQQITTVLAELQNPNGLWPHVGDEDGGRLYFLSRSLAGDFRSLLEVCRLLLLEGKAKQMTPHFVDDFWLLGLTGDGKDDLPAANDASVYLESSGIIVSRSTGGMQSTMQCGRFGYLDSPHSHADMFHLDLSVGEDNFLIDPGTYVYTGDVPTRNHFRSELMHNGPAVDGLEIMNRTDPFSWLSKPDCVVENYVRTNRSEYYQASYSANVKGAGDARVTRSVLFLHDRMWLVYDSVSARKPSKVGWNFVTPRTVDIKKGTALLRGKASNLAIIPCLPDSANYRLITEECPISDDYLSTYSGNIVRITTEKRSDFSALFVLLPFQQDSDLPISCTTVCEGNRLCVTLETGEYREQIYFGNSEVSELGKLETDASCAYIHSHSGLLERAVIIDGSYLKIAGELILQTKEKTRCVDLMREGDHYAIETADRVELIASGPEKSKMKRSRGSE